MSYEFKKLSEVEALTEVPEGATVLAEVNGAIKRIPGAGLGGGAAGPVIQLNTTSDEAFAASPSSMTFEDAYAAFQSNTLGIPMFIIELNGMKSVTLATSYVDFTASLGSESLGLLSEDLKPLIGTDLLTWTADGFSKVE